MPVKIFFCYAHEDEPLLNKLKAHLRPLQRQGLIDVWHDRDISAGTEWEQEINKHLNDAKIILLLVSPDFMDSDYCYGIEMKKALERHERGEAKVIPIILRPVYWQGLLGKLQALPTDAKPVISSSWHYLDEAFFDVSECIRKALETFDTKALINQLIEPSTTQNLTVAHPNKNILGKPSTLEIESKLKKIIIDILRVDESEVVPNASFRDDLKIDSLDGIEIIMEAEKVFRLQISDEEAEKISTVQEALEYLEYHLAQRE